MNTTRKTVLGATLLTAVLMLLVSGCATQDPENVSARPWNAPKSWENGIPASIMQGR